MVENGMIPRELAHELRTPLAAVITSLDLITDPTMELDPSEVAEIVQAARDDAAHLLDVIESARSSNGDARYEEVNVADVLSRALMRFPGVQARTRLRVDPLLIAIIGSGHLDQIATNLFQNVARYAPDGVVELRIYRDGDDAVLEIADEGPGIDDPSEAFEPQEAGSDHGMHVGLSLSRRLAESAAGSLEVADEPILSGATLRLRLRAGDRGRGSSSRAALAPRARVLVELASALRGRSIAQAEAGISRIAADLIGAKAAAILVGRPDAPFETTGGDSVPADDPILHKALSSQEILRLEDQEGEWWTRIVGEPSGLVIPLAADTGHPAVLILGTDRIEGANDEILRALATVAEVAVSREKLGQALGVERGLRATVMDALPIAISVFAGDPPRLIDMNEKERQMLRISKVEERPSALAKSQSKFEVRFADGTPLSLENAPVVNAIREGASQGPFILKVTRKDGTEFLSRTHSAPFFDVDGNVAGAVVTSEEIHEDELPEGSVG